MSHLGAESEKTNTTMCKLGFEWSLSKRVRQVSCVYVVGIIGLAPYTTHYSVLLKLNKKVEHTILAEGKPVNDEIYDNVPKYFRI